MNVIAPVVLDPCNFTPLHRTPWAGYNIARHIKQKVLSRAGDVECKIGESWEFSCDSQFMSRLVSSPLSLCDFLAMDPSAILSPCVVQKRQLVGHCPLLVKLIEASYPLSFQVHPDDQDGYLAEDECGKPESWLILQVEKGAGIYLGFQDGVTMDQLCEGLRFHQDIEHLMQFVAVKPGDYFDLPPGVPHAIGSGVTLAEPQRILAGKHGKTYRMWDWNRRYDACGNVNEAGQSRELHIEESLRLVAPELQQGTSYVATLQKKPRRSSLNGVGHWYAYPANADYQSHLVELFAASRVNLTLQDTYLVVVAVRGDSCWSWRSAEGVEQQLMLLQGHTMLLPAAIAVFDFTSEGACQVCLFHDSLGEISLK
ncbi:MAG: hypothetical protein OXT67_11500 [Zetaproteobacteria bacterium]|nr:hypothetical protein [Zetaproteobacteria bacterium]